jgi:cell wall assembly regulator SMI1
MKKITHFIVAGAAFLSAHAALAQTARVQVIHNSADAAAALVDVYLNGTILLNDFAFRTATPFIDAPAGVPIQIDIAPGTSTSVAQSIYNIAPTLTSGETYVVIANGIVSPTGYAPAQPFGLSVFAQGRETASFATSTDVLVNHGSTDAPTVDVVETSVPAGTIVDDISYPNFTSDYLEFPTADYVLSVKDATGTVTVATYAAPLATLNLQGAALTVLASGFLNPAVNSDGPAFGLYVALASGGALIPLPLVTPPPTARVQVIHNSADAAAALVDVYVNGDLLLNDFAFRTATPFVDAPAGTPIQIDIAPSTSTSVAQSIYNISPTLTAGETYVLVANGIVSPTGYTPAQPFGLSVFAQGREASSNAGNTDVLVNHGSTDAPTVDVVETSVPAGTIVDNISYPNFTSSYLELPTADYTLAVKDATGTVTVATYGAPLGTLNLQGVALTVVASGFLNPTVNSDGPAFGLYVALPSGGALIPLPLITLPTTARVQVIHNSADAAAALVDVYLNGDLLLNDFAFRTATPFIDAPAGTPIQIDIAPGTSTSVAQSIYNIAPTLTAGETYVLVANGIVSPTGYTPAQPFGLSVFSQGREEATNTSNTDVLVNHGSTDAPTVDVVEANSGGTVVNDISFPNFNSDYLELPTSDYVLDVKSADGAVLVARYNAPLQTLNLQGAALVVVASGFLNPAVNSNGAAFGLWVALPAGGSLVELPAVLSSQAFDFSTVAIFPNPTSEVLNINIPFSFDTVSGQVIDISGRAVKSINKVENSIDVSNLSNGLYVLDLLIDNKPFKQKFIVSKN